MALYQVNDLAFQLAPNYVYALNIWERENQWHRLPEELWFGFLLSCLVSLGSGVVFVVKARRAGKEGGVHG